jgi:hypothetical protein
MNTNRYQALENDARQLVAGGILLLDRFDQDDMTFLDRVEAANELLARESDEQAKHAGEFGRGS